MSLNLAAQPNLLQAFLGRDQKVGQNTNSARRSERHQAKGLPFCIYCKFSGYFHLESVAVTCHRSHSHRLYLCRWYLSVSPHAKSAPLPICPYLPTPHTVPRATSLKYTGLIHYSAISLVQRPRGQRVGSLCALSSPRLCEECRNAGLVSRTRPEGWWYRVCVSLNAFTPGSAASQS